MIIARQGHGFAEAKAASSILNTLALSIKMIWTYLSVYWTANVKKP